MPYRCSNCLSTVYSVPHVSGDACPYCGTPLAGPGTLFHSMPLAALAPRTKRLVGASVAASRPASEVADDAQPGQARSSRRGRNRDDRAFL